jgi:predicted DNA-binding transcriptional regulator YafY
MAYGKAEELLQLALRLAASRSGLSANEIESELGSGPKAALEKKRQRMMNALRGLFPAELDEKIEGGRRFWSLRTKELDHLPILQPSDLAMLERAANALVNSNDADGASRLRMLRDRLASALSRRGEKNYEADLEAMLQGQALAARPGPRPVIQPDVSEAVGQAIMELKLLAFVYESAGGQRAERMVEPVGVLLGGRHYLVARVYNAPIGSEPIRWRLDRMTEVRVIDEGIRAMPEGFVFREMARKAFGVYYNEAEFGEVVWRFAPKAARAAAAYHFHPDQKLEQSSDGSLTVRFWAAGHLEMAWHLYQWGEQVEVLAPRALAELVNGYRRSDFTAVP